MKIIKNSILAAIFISFGVMVLLTTNEILGPLLFSFGLLGVCYFQADLFTGKAGYYWKGEKLKLLKILLINLTSGYILGFLFSLVNSDLILIAQEKVMIWNFSLSYFLKSIFCGMIMYICVNEYKENNSIIGILYGVPLFIFCGFQHSIANIIILGVARTFSWTIIICILGNLLGSIIINLLDNKEKEK